MRPIAGCRGQGSALAEHPIIDARRAFAQEARTLSQAVRAADPQTLTEEAESL